MLETRVIPCLLLKGRALVKTIQFQNPSYIGDPCNTVRIFNEQEVDELIILDINATQSKSEIQFDLIEQIAGECFMPITYGGGIQTLDDVAKIFSLGVEKVAINTYAIEHPEFVSQVAKKYGNQSIVVPIDVKKRFWRKSQNVYCMGGRQRTLLSPVDHAVHMEQAGAGELLVTSINRDGMMQGYDIDLIKAISDAVSIPIIACGGAGNLNDFRLAVQMGGASAVATGSMVVYQGINRAVLVNFPTREELRPILNFL